MFSREPDQRNVIRMILRSHTMARVAIERGSGKFMGLWINRRCVTACATQREGIGIPGLVIARKQIELSIAVLLEPAVRRMPAQDIRDVGWKILGGAFIAVPGMNGPAVGILLP